jgi:hypothetical protein
VYAEGTLSRGISPLQRVCCFEKQNAHYGKHFAFFSIPARNGGLKLGINDYKFGWARYHRIVFFLPVLYVA